MNSVSPSAIPDTRSARRVLRFGWIAKGVVFVVIGALAIEIARRGASGQATDQKGALREIASAPLGSDRSWRRGYWIVALCRMADLGCDCARLGQSPGCVSTLSGTAVGGNLLAATGLGITAAGA